MWLIWRFDPTQGCHRLYLSLCVTVSSDAGDVLSGKAASFSSWSEALLRLCAGAERGDCAGSRPWTSVNTREKHALFCDTCIIIIRKRREVYCSDNFIRGIQYEVDGAVLPLCSAWGISGWATSQRRRSSVSERVSDGPVVSSWNKRNWREAGVL